MSETKRAVVQGPTLEEQIGRLESVFHNSYDAIITMNSRSEIISLNRSCLDIFGYDEEEELIGQRIEVLMNSNHADRHSSYVGEHLAGKKGPHQVMGKLRRINAARKNGSLVPVDIHVTEYEYDGDRYFVGFVRDMSSIESSEARLHRSLFYDKLTGLPNQETLTRSLDFLLKEGVGLDVGFLLMEIGIDQMRAINTTFGMDDGNTVIRLVGQRLAQSLIPAEFFGRGNGDRFTALFEIPAGWTAEKMAHEMHIRMIEALSAPFEFGAARVSISVTAGGLEIPKLATESGMAMRYADMAYYEAKKSHRGEVYLLSSEDVARVIETSSMVHKIRDALQMQEFFPVFQPKIDLETGGCHAAECLIRWRTQDGTMIPPGIFIPVAESADLIEGIGRFIFLESCAALHEWKSDPVLSKVKLAVNISPKQVERQNFVEFVGKTLETFEIPPSSLEFEITETTLANNPKVTFAKVAELMKMGISISIDDFGTGQSSLGMLRDVAASRAKVDRAFLDGVPENDKSNRLLRNIVNLMRDMDLLVTVEGIETAEVADYVKTLRCEEAQGYFFARPLEKADFEAFVQKVAADKGVMPG